MATLEQSQCYAEVTFAWSPCFHASGNPLQSQRAANWAGMLCVKKRGVRPVILAFKVDPTTALVPSTSRKSKPRYLIESSAGSSLLAT